MTRTTTKPRRAKAVRQPKVATPQWDVFISHASEDKRSLVIPLANVLARFGVRVWYDRFTLTPGDSLSRSIDKGLAASKCGLVVLSPHFFKKKWSEYELRGLIVRELSGQRVIPLWFKVSQEDVARYSPPLADKLALIADSGRITELAIEIIEHVRPDIFEHIKTRKAFLGTQWVSGKVKLKDVLIAPIRHKELPAHLIGRIRLLRAALFEVHPASMKSWVDDFRRDAHPSREIEAWERIAAAYLEYRTAKQPQSRDEIQAAFQAAFAASLNASDKQLARAAAPLPVEDAMLIGELVASPVPIFDIQDSDEEEARIASPEELAGLDLERFPHDVPNDLVRAVVKK